MNTAPDPIITRIETLTEQADKMKAELRDLLEEYNDQRAYDAAKAEGGETFPAEVVNRLIAGHNPIAVYREHRGKSQEWLAEQAGTSAGYISQIENGRRHAGRTLQRRIADALDVEAADLVE